MKNRFTIFLAAFFIITINSDAKEIDVKITNLSAKENSLEVDCEIKSIIPVKLPDPGSIFGIIYYTLHFVTPSGAIVRCRAKPTNPPSGRISFQEASNSSPLRFRIILKDGTTEFLDRLGSGKVNKVYLEVNLPEDPNASSWSGRKVSESVEIDLNLSMLSTVSF